MEATQRLVGNILLTPPSVVATARAASASASARAVRPSLQAASTGRSHLVRVAGADASALRAAVAAVARVPGDAVLEPAPGGGLQLRTHDGDPLSGHAAVWQDAIVTRLHKAGVAPTLIVA